MKLLVQDQLRTGGRIIYDADRPGHEGVEAVVLAVDVEGMAVQSHERADTTYTLFSDRRWMDFISVVG